MIRDTIKKHEDFATDDKDPIAKSRYFLIRAKRTRFPKDARYGLVVAKKKFKHAVDRNRAKRLMRDWIAFNEKLLRRDWDYIFIARQNILEATRTDGRVAMGKALSFLRRQNIHA